MAGLPGHKKPGRILSGLFPEMAARLRRRHHHGQPGVIQVSSRRRFRNDQTFLQLVPERVGLVSGAPACEASPPI